MQQNMPKRPLYQQIRNHIASAVARGEYPPGSALPGIIEFGKYFNASKATVAHALNLLAAEGLIRCRKGSAARVLPPQTRRGHWRIAVTIGNFSEAYSEFPYLGGSTIWTLQQLVLRRLTMDHNPALNLSGSDWKRHIQDVDGVLMIRPSDYHDGSIEWLQARGLPWVVLETYSKDLLDINFVSLDFAVGAIQAATSLLSRGVRRIYTALMPGAPQMPLDDRFDSFFQTLHEHGFPDDEIENWPRLSNEYGEILPERLDEIVIPALQMAPRPIGILSGSDMQCLGLIQAARRLNLKLKKDIFIIGASGLPESAIRQPALTVLEPPFEKLANAGIAMLYRMLETRVLSVDNLRFPVRLVVRGT